jgi:D-inositol-3-phosphate glycosyltransferase
MPIPRPLTKRIAIVCLHTCPWEPPGGENVGGMNVYVRKTAVELAAKGWDVDIFTRLHAGASCSSLPSPGVRLIHLPAGPVDTDKGNLHQWLDQFVRGVCESGQALNRQSDSVRRENVDGQYCAVVSHYWLSGLAAIDLAKHWRVPHIASFHTLALAKQAAFPAGAEPAIRSAGEHRIVAEAHYLIAVSQHEHDVLTELYEADSDRISIASPGIDNRQFRPLSRQDARRQLGLPQHARIILTVGRNSPIKGFNVLLEALARISDPQVLAVFVGVSPHDDGHLDLLTCARRLKIEQHVRFVGGIEHDLLPSYYAACDVCAVPSLYESFGLAALEAIGCGCPVVASRVGGLPSIVAGNPSGVLVTPGSVSELAMAIEHTLGKGKKLNSTTSPEKNLPSWSSTSNAILEVLMDVVSK